METMFTHECFFVQLETRGKLGKGDLGATQTTAAFLKHVKEHAKQRKAAQPTEQDVVAVILSQAGYKVQKQVPSK